MKKFKCLSFVDLRLVLSFNVGIKCLGSLFKQKTLNFIWTHKIVLKLFFTFQVFTIVLHGKHKIKTECPVYFSCKNVRHSKSFFQIIKSKIT